MIIYLLFYLVNSNFFNGFYPEISQHGGGTTACGSQIVISKKNDLFITNFYFLKKMKRGIFPHITY